MSKTWAIATNCGPTHVLLKRECSCKRDHAACRGRDASRSENYTDVFVDCVHKSFKEFARMRSSRFRNLGSGSLPCSAPALCALAIMDPRGWKLGSHSGTGRGDFEARTVRASGESSGCCCYRPPLVRTRRLMFAARTCWHGRPSSLPARGVKSRPPGRQRGVKPQPSRSNPAESVVALLLRAPPLPGPVDSVVARLLWVPPWSRHDPCAWHPSPPKSPRSSTHRATRDRR